MSNQKRKPPPGYNQELMDFWALNLTELGRLMQLYPGGLIALIHVILGLHEEQGHEGVLRFFEVCQEFFLANTQEMP